MLNDYTSQWSGVTLPARRHSDVLEEIIVIYMDVNNFKTINDKYGHRKGDTALISISEHLKKIFRNEDHLFRIGGDEFLATMKVNANEETTHIINRLNCEFERIFYVSPDGDTKLTISHGISKGQHRNIEFLINEADILMYQKR